MKLHLTNFKSWENETFEFPESGITLISAESGRGKSSLMQAILFALYGTGNKITMYGKKKMKVVMEFDGIKIERSKGPNKLLVNDTYTDSEGQEIIDKKFSKVFDTIGYIEQKSASNFVTMSPTDKLSFIERFVFQDVNLVDIKKNIKRISNERVNELNTMKGEYNMLERMIDDMKEKHDFKDNIPKGLEKKIDKTKKELETKNKKIKELETYYNDVKYNNANIEKITTKLNNKRDELKIKETEYIGDDKLNEYKSLVSDYVKYQEMLEYNQTKKNIKELKSKLVDIDEHKLYQLQDLVTEYKIYQEITELNFDEKEYEEKKEASQNKFIVCPSCNENLVISSSEVKVCEKIFDNSKLKKEMKDMEKVYIKHNGLITRLSKDLEYYKDVEIDSLSNKLKTMTNSLEEQKNIKRELKILKKKLKNVEEIETSKVDIEFNQVQELISVNTELKCFISSSKKEVDEYEQQLTSLKVIDIQPIQDEIKQLEKDIQNSDKELTKFNQYLEKQKVLDTFKEYEKKRQQLVNKLEEQEKKCISIEILKKNIGVAQNIAITNIIETIEVSAQSFIDKFFNEPMVIKLNTFNKTNKPQINIDIFYKDNDTTFSNLSGGEQDRFVLAFTMALSELFNTNLILLDETIASLDIETTSNNISNIRNSTMGKLVLCISHQLVNGSFDKVVNL